MLDASSDELAQCLSEDSIYTNIVYTNAHKKYNSSIFLLNGVSASVIIDKDLIIPPGKSLWLNNNCTLKISEGAMLKIEQAGRVETFNEPVIEGTVTGDITIIGTETPRDVYTFAELYQAIRYRAKIITLKNSITVATDIAVGKDMTLIVDKDVTLTLKTPQLIIREIINNGMINGTGSILVYAPISGTGSVNTADGLFINIDIDSVDDIAKCFSEDSHCTSINFIDREKSDKKENVLVKIDKNLVIPENNKLWLNCFCTLEVSEGVTLTIDGKLETYNQPVINGTVVGKIDVLDIN